MKSQLQPTLLIVDDQPVNIQALSNLLKSDYRILIATSGEKALKIVADGRELPDLILLDIQMPEMDGYEVCKRLKSDGRTSDIPVIFVTARTSPEDEENGLSLGAADYIPKPFQPQIVRARVKNLLARKISEKALRQANHKLNLLSSITRHDINNKLMVINGYLMILKKKIDPSTEDLLTKVITASSQIASIIQFTKEYEGIGIHSPVWQDLNDLIDKTIGHFNREIIIIKNKIPAGLAIFADPLAGKVIYNLIDNSVRHGGKVTKILFSVQPSSGSMVIICEDDGDGVSTIEKEDIFKQGYGKNTGMGLFLVREILAITGISITEAGEEGKGARFLISVPAGMWRITGDQA